jgi:hypothetical protein
MVVVYLRFDPIESAGKQFGYKQKRSPEESFPKGVFSDSCEMWSV